MGEQKGPWPMSVTFIALSEGCWLKVCPSGRAYVIICGSGGLRSRGPRPNSILKPYFTGIVDTGPRHLTNNQVLKFTSAGLLHAA